MTLNGKLNNTIITFPHLLFVADFLKSAHARHPDTRTTPPLHVAYPQQGDQAGDNGQEMAVGARIPIQAQCQERARQAGHSDAQVQDSNFC